jgi:sugar phosphate isomerase/epimerase
MHDLISVNHLCFLSQTVAELEGTWRELDARRVSFVGGLLTGDQLAIAERIVKTHGYPVETVNHVFLPGPLVPDEATWEEPRRKLLEIIRIANRLGSRTIYMLSGGHGSLDWDEAADCFRRAIAPCVTEADKVGIRLAIENAPILYADLHLAHSLRDTVTLAEIAGIGVCADLFGCWCEQGIHGTIARAGSRIVLVQISDFVLGDRSLPARAVPGDGVIPLRRLTERILQTGYSGGFDLELLGPRIEREGALSAVRRAGDHFGAVLESLGV